MFTYLMEHHSFYSLFKPHWILFALLLTVFYVKRMMITRQYNVTKNQIFYFFTSVLILLLLKATPIDVIGKHYLFSVHVLQLSFIFFIAIPLFILSLPKNFLRQLVWHHQMRLFITVLSHPWLSLITFNGLLTVYFIPNVFTFLQQYNLLQIIAQFILLVTAIFMWWVIIQPVPEMKVLNHLLRASYIFFASLALMPIGFYFVIVQKIHFPIYYQVEGVISSILTLIYDQQLGGGILKITQMFSYSFALLFILLQWGRREEAKEGTVDVKNIRYVRGVVIHLDDDKQ